MKLRSRSGVDRHVCSHSKEIPANLYGFRYAPPACVEGVDFECAFEPLFTAMAVPMERAALRDSVPDGLFGDRGSAVDA